jgi:hypothetical protein
VAQVKDSFVEISNEVVKIAVALFVGGLTAYIQQRRKEKANRLAEIMASSEFWKKEVADLKAYTTEKVKDLETKMQTCYEELREYQSRN